MEDFTVAEPHGRFGPKPRTAQDILDRPEHEGCMYFDKPYFTLKDIKHMQSIATRAGMVEEEARFTFGQRLDLSSNPFTLCIMGPIGKS